MYYHLQLLTLIFVKSELNRPIVSSGHAFIIPWTFELYKCQTKEKFPNSVSMHRNFLVFQLFFCWTTVAKNIKLKN